MNKSELIATVAEHIDGDKKTVAKVLDGILDTVQLAVAAGDKVAITGFGSFEASERAARTGRNPQTGDPIAVAASWAPKFKAGSGFKGLVNESSRTPIPA